MSRSTGHRLGSNWPRLVGMAVAGLALAPVAAWASMVGGFSSTPTSATLPASFLDDTLVADIVIGTGTCGPYLLTWTGIQRGTERVTVNDTPALAGLDYQLDYGAGKITFTRPLRATDMARVEYAFQRGAKANAQGAAAPVSIPLTTIAGTDLAMVYAYKPSSTGPSQETVLLGLTGDKDAGSDARLTGRFLVSESGAREQAPAGERTAYQLTASDRVGSLGLSAHYARAGQSFAGSKEFGLKAGLQTWDIGAQYDQGPLSGSTKYVAGEDTVGGERSGTWQHNLAFGAPGLPSIALMRTDQSSFDDGGRLESRQIADQLSLRQTFGATGLLVERKTLAVTPAGEPRRQLVGDRLALEQQLTPGTKVTAARESTIAYLPGDETERTIADSVGISTRLHQSVTADAGHEQKTLPDGNVTRTDRFGLGGAPLSWLRFKLAHLQSNGSTQDNAKSTASVSLTPGEWASLSAGFERTIEGDYRRDVSRLQTMLQPVSFLTLEGGYVSRQDGTAAGSVDSSRAKVALALASRLRLTGEYTANPEDDKGRFTCGEAAKVGVASDLGRVGVKGSYGRRIDAVGAEMRDSQVDMSVALTTSTKVYTGYRLSESLQPVLTSDQETYRVGFDHAVGGDFSLSLEAQRVLYHENERYIAARSETRAEARLNMRW
jgi:hypothetical protein